MPSQRGREHGLADVGAARSQGRTNHSPEADCGPLPFFVNKVLSAHGTASVSYLG
jgi:hypothetical protein